MAFFDVRQLERGLQTVERAMPQAIQRGLGEAGATLLDDSKSLPPTPPKKTGRLRESGSVIVGQLTVATTLGKEGATEAGTPNTSPMPEKVGGRWACFVGYNTQYAAKMHNVPMGHYSEAGSGRNFLTDKMRNYKNKYLAVLADVVKRELRAG